MLQNLQLELYDSRITCMEYPRSGHVSCMHKFAIDIWRWSWSDPVGWPWSEDSCKSALVSRCRICLSSDIHGTINSDIFSSFRLYYCLGTRFHFIFLSRSDAVSRGGPNICYLVGTFSVLSLPLTCSVVLHAIECPNPAFIWLPLIICQF